MYFNNKITYLKTADLNNLTKLFLLTVNEFHN